MQGDTRERKTGNKTVEAHDNHPQDCVMATPTYRNPQVILWVALYIAILVWSVWNPTDRFTWWLEVSPSLIGIAVMLATYKRFPLTPALYWMILFHSAILYVGGHYTYAEVPFPNLFGDLFPHGRNNFDKIGHFFQGVTPCMIARELYVRITPLKKGKLLAFATITAALAFSAFYEMIEWWVSACTGSGGDAFLGTQGYVWDTQSDMLMALIGATVAALTISHLQNAQMKARGWLKD
jgi:putative membrane protein